MGSMTSSERWEPTTEWPFMVAALAFLTAYVVPILDPGVDHLGQARQRELRSSPKFGERSFSFRAVGRSARRERRPRAAHQMITTSRTPAVRSEPAGVELVHGPVDAHDPLRTLSASTSSSPATAAPAHHHKPRVRRCII